MTWNKHYYNKEYREVFSRGFVLLTAAGIHINQSIAFLYFIYCSRPPKKFKSIQKHQNKWPKCLSKPVEALELSIRGRYKPLVLLVSSIFLKGARPGCLFQIH